MIKFSNFKELLALSEEKNTSLPELIVEYEVLNSGKSEISIKNHMAEIWQVMEKAALKGINNQEKSLSRMVGGDAQKLAHGTGYCGPFMRKATSYAVAVAETNALMGKIVACPTAGSCGIVPGVLMAAKEEYKYSDEEICDALFVATGIGMIIENNAMIAGAQGGCQAECGSAAGMAAGALVYLADGSNQQIADGVALAIKNLLGLACDPVAGLVEVPCVKRNGFAASVAVLAADMALAGIRSVIPVDEVIDAMYRIGKSLPSSLKETACGGLATSPTGLKLKNKIFGNND